MLIALTIVMEQLFLSMLESNKRIIIEFIGVGILGRLNSMNMGPIYDYMQMISQSLLRPCQRAVYPGPCHLFSTNRSIDPSLAA